MRCCHSSGVPSVLRSRMLASAAGLLAVNTRPPSCSHACQFAGSAPVRLHTPISPRSGSASATRGASGACLPHARCSAFNQCWTAAEASLCTRRRGNVAALGCSLTGIGCGRHCTSRDSCRRVPSRPGRGSGTCTVNAVPQAAVRPVHAAGWAGKPWTRVALDQWPGSRAPANASCPLRRCRVVRSRPALGLRPSTQWGLAQARSMQVVPAARPTRQATAGAPAATASHRSGCAGAADLCTQPAQRGEIQRCVRMAAGEVDQQRQQPCSERGQAQREQQGHAPPLRPNSACSGWSSGWSSQPVALAMPLACRRDCNALRASAKRCR